MAIRVLIWNEGRHEKQNPKVAEIYPNGMHGAIAAHLRKFNEFTVSTATLDDPEQGCSEKSISDSDVLLWWGHMHHDDVADAAVERIQNRVVAGMGLIVLHSGHFSKIFRRLMGTTCNLKWREHEEEREILWVTRPGHPIVQGIDDHFILPHEEMYGEFFDIPEPECTFLISSFSGGEVFRSGCTWSRGAGRVVYFRPGHETFPSYHDKNVLRIIENAARWAAPTRPAEALQYGNRPSGWIDPD